MKPNKVIFQFLVRKGLFPPALSRGMLYKKNPICANLFFHILGDIFVANLQYE